MNKMYLQSDNGGYGVLVTDGLGHWWYWHEHWLPVDLNAPSDEGNAEIIRVAIENGEMYDANDFVNEAEDERMIIDYTGRRTIEEIDSYENKGRDFDLTTWIEI